jgi:hypothetical protein
MSYSSERTFALSGDKKSTPASHFRAGRVFLLDSLNAGHHPTLYQLKDHTLDSLLDKENKFISLKNEDFIPVGDVRSVDKDKRIIYLEDGGLVAYEHLIIASTVDSNILASTICALKVQHQSKGNLKNDALFTVQNRLIERMKVQSSKNTTKFDHLYREQAHVTTISATLNGRECFYELLF